MSIDTVQHVIRELGAIIDVEAAKGSRLALFPALYREMTERVAKGLAAGEFSDPQRLERLTVVFAKRYLDALTSYRAGERPSKSWCVAFDESHQGKMMAIQDVLLGVNAHINFDLSVAVAEVGGEEVEQLRPDFDKINDLLKELLDRAQAVLDDHSPMLDILDRVAGNKDEVLGMFAIEKARSVAWSNAVTLAKLDRHARAAWMQLIDISANRMGHMIANPRLVVRKALELIGETEERDVKVLVAAFSGVQPNR